MFVFGFLSFLIILNIQFDRSSAATDYCAICKYHTMCRYTNNRVCARSFDLGHNVSFSADEINAIVNLHNSMRFRVATGNEKRGSPGPQPKATNMQPLKWDKELAEIAQRWANQCMDGRDSCRDVQRFPVGQNAVRNNIPEYNVPMRTTAQQITERTSIRTEAVIY